MDNLKRRQFLLMLCCTLCFAAQPALASDDEGDDGESESSDSGSSGSDNSDDSKENEDKSENSGSGKTTSDDGETSNSGKAVSASKLKERNEEEHERALRAVAAGKASSLKKLKIYLDQNHPGKLLSVRLERKSGDLFYKVRILTVENRITSLTLDALSLKPRF
jgi:uncharacterized membrane protein YkoI